MKLHVLRQIAPYPNNSLAQSPSKLIRSHAGDWIGGRHLSYSRIGLPNADHPIIQSAQNQQQHYPVVLIWQIRTLPIIQKGLAFGCERSGTATVPGASSSSGSCPRRLHGPGGAVVVAANDAAPTQWRIPMPKLTDTQLVILSAASQRDDRGVELPANLKGGAACKVVDKLIRAGLLEEVRANGSLPVWRRDDESGPMALCITKNGLEAIDVEDEATAAPAEAIASRKQI